jgi:hypothetical protein
LYSSLDEELQWHSGGEAEGALEKRDAWAKAGITLEKLKEHDSESHVFLFGDTASLRETIHAAGERASDCIGGKITCQCILRQPASCESNGERRID